MALGSKQQVTEESRAALKIGEVAKLSGIGIEALRFYERSGLLGRPARTQSGYRVDDTAVLKRLDFIKRAQVLGFSLGDKENHRLQASRAESMSRGARNCASSSRRIG